ncbi:hypothetical protein TRFO_20855 [Tritrichomonas foetus]|uniref:UBR-type domain-containing protein n=1 Tax=Tritrichomonas foetus TaxID=1144522 RepID=A0A1J4KF31_9EUKA|nr:hypothetical protein TRFO_20855 [Tritrichomonas foetus]|eukprot:OHT10047.1 hypothetical protein TRFO_20855 [Tritrichomonas foetus]
MEFSQNFAFLSPLRTLNDFNYSLFSDNNDFITTIWLILGQLDIDSISDADLESVSMFWCKSVMLARIKNLIIKPKPTNALYFSHILCAKVAFSLYKRLRAIEKPSFEPIFSLCGISDDIFNDCDEPPIFPIKFSPVFLKNYPIVEYFRQHSDIPRYHQIVSWVLRFDASSDEIIKNELKDFIDPDQEYFFDMDKIEITDSFTREIELSLLPILIIRYTLNTIFNDNIQPPIKKPDIYTKLTEKLLSADINPNDKLKLCQTFIYVSGDKIDLPFEFFIDETFPSSILTLIFLSDQYNNVDLYKLFEKQLKTRSSILFSIPHMKCIDDFNKFRDFLNSKSYSDSWINELKGYLLIKDPVEKLVQQSLTGNAIASKQLLSQPECLQFLTPEKSILHQILTVLLSDSMTKLPENPEKTNVTAAVIYKSLQLKTSIDFAPIIVSLHQYLTEQIDLIAKSKNFAHLVFAGFPPPEANGGILIVIPHESRDLIVDLSKDPISLIFLNIYMIIYAIDITNTNILFDDKVSTDCLVDIFADYSLNFFYGTHLYSLIQPLFNRFNKQGKVLDFDEILMKRKAFHILQAFQDKNERSKVLDLIQPSISNTKNDELVSKLTSFFVSDSDLDSLSKLISVASNSTQVIINALDKDSQKNILELIIEKDDHDLLQKVVPLLIQSDESLFEFLGETAMKKPKLITPLFSSCNFSNENFLKSIVSFSGEISVDFANLLRKLIKSFLVYNCTRRNTEVIPKINISWGDAETHERIDPWAFPEKVESKHFIGTGAVFACYTCGITGDNYLCLNCALKCHKNHDITYSKLIEATTCNCINCCLNKPETIEESKSPSEETATKESNNENAFKDDNKDENQEMNKNICEMKTVDPSTLLKLCSSLLNSQIQKPPNPLQITRFSGDILNIDITTYKSIIVPTKLKFAPIQSPKLIDMQAMTSELTSRNFINHFFKRSVAYPMFTAIVGGPFCNILVVCSGNLLTSYNMSTMQQLSSYKLSHYGLVISFCPLDQSIFAVASLHHVMILSITEDGVFSETDEIELMLDAIGQHIFVDSIAWIPLAALQLAVVCNSFIKIYDIPTDRFSPIACFTIDQPDYFTSACFVEHDDECYGLFAMSTGKIAIQNCNVDAADGPIPLTKFAHLPYFNRNVTISYCSENDLFFLSAPDIPLYIMRLNEIFSEKPKYLTINLQKYSVNLYFVFNTNALHFFVNPLSGAIVTIEFTDSEIEVSSLSQNIPVGNLPLFDRSIATLTTFNMEGELHAIGQSGKILSLQSADINDEQEDDDSEEEENSVCDMSLINSSFSVPATFWTTTTVCKSSIDVTSPGIPGDYSNLISGNRFTFPGQLMKKALDISLKDDNSLILGFRIYAGSSSHKHRPPFAKIFGRKHVFTGPRSVLIPLKPDEIGPRKHYRINFGSNNNNDICIDGLDVFTLPVIRLSRKYTVQSREFDWMKDSTDIFDFSDSLHIMRTNDFISELIGRVSASIPEFLVDDKTIEFLVEILYTKPEVALAARRILIKGSPPDAKNRVLQIWANIISRLVNEKKINEKQWPLLWRDVALLPKTLRTQITPLIWKSQPQVSGTFSIMTAFFTE